MTSSNQNNEVIEIIENNDLEKFITWISLNDCRPFIGKSHVKISILEHLLNELDGQNTPSNISKMINALIKTGYDVNNNSDGYYPVLHSVIEKNHSITKILLEAGAMVNVKDIYGDTPLTQAVLDEDVELVKVLLHYSDKEAVNSFGSVYCKTPIGIAFMKVNLDLIRLLYENGADPFIIDYDNGGIPMYKNLPESISQDLYDKIMLVIGYHS